MGSRQQDPTVALVAPAKRGDVQRAEALLHALAAELLRVPMRGSARELHLCALRLKRRVADWPADVPDSVVLDTIREIIELQRQALDARLAARTWRGGGPEVDRVDRA